MVAGLGSLIALLLIPFTPAGVPVIAASAAALLGLRAGRPPHWEAAVTEVWVTIAVLAVATAAIRAAGPVLLGGRDLPAPLQGVIALIAPALLAALVVVETLGAAEGGALESRRAGARGRRGRRRALGRRLDAARGRARRPGHGADSCGLF